MSIESSFEGAAGNARNAPEQSAVSHQLSARSDKLQLIADSRRLTAPGLRDTGAAVRVLSLVVLAALGGCIQDAPPPNPGKCALGPPGKKVWTWGEIRIGTCLSGPADMRFFERGGGTYLAVSNANPYLDYKTGSLLVIDWDSIDLTRDINYLHELDAGAIPIDDYVGGFGVIESKDRIVISGRRSDLASGRASDDRIYQIDIDRPLNPTRHVENPRIAMRDDPYPVVVDEPSGRMYVGHLTDHSVAVFDITGDEPERIDVAPGTVISIGELQDPDGSGSVALIDAVDVVLAQDLRDDLWTLDWIDGTARVWVPEPNTDDEVGLVRHTDVGIGPVASALGIELDAADIGAFRDASFAELEAPYLYYVDDSTGAILRITNSGADGLGVIGNWSVDTIDLELSGGAANLWGSVLGSPDVEFVDELTWLFYDARDPDGQPAIGLSVETGDPTFPNAEAPILDAADVDGFLGFEDPSAWHDISHDGVRLWMTAILDDGSTAIALSETRDDGGTWSEPEIVHQEAGFDLSNPVVKRRHGRFEMWFTRDDGTAWTHAHAWSWGRRELGGRGRVPPLAGHLRRRCRTPSPGRADAGVGGLAARRTGPGLAARPAGFRNHVRGLGSGLHRPNRERPTSSTTASSRTIAQSWPSARAATWRSTASRRCTSPRKTTRGSGWACFSRSAAPGSRSTRTSFPPTKAGTRRACPTPWCSSTRVASRCSTPRPTRRTSPRSDARPPRTASTGRPPAAQRSTAKTTGTPSSSSPTRSNSSRTARFGSGTRAATAAASASDQRTASGPNANLQPEVGEFDPWRFEPGVPGQLRRRRRAGSVRVHGRRRGHPPALRRVRRPELEPGSTRSSKPMVRSPDGSTPSRTGACPRCRAKA